MHHDVPPPRAAQLSRPDIVRALEDEHLRTDDARKPCPAEDGEDEDNHQIAFPEEIGQHDGERERRDHEHDVHHTHDDRVADAAHIARQEPHQRAKERNADTGDQSDQQRYARAVDHHGENILTCGDGGAKRVLKRGTQPLFDSLGHVIGIKGRNQRCEYGASGEQQRDDESDSPLGMTPDFAHKRRCGAGSPAKCFHRLFPPSVMRGSSSE